MTFDKPKGDFSDALPGRIASVLSKQPDLRY
jgi:hypothetical protein